MKDWIKSIFEERKKESLKGGNQKNSEYIKKTSINPQFSTPKPTLKEEEKKEETIFRGKSAFFEKLTPLPSRSEVFPTKKLCLDNLKGVNFENFCLDHLLKKMGFTGKVTVASGDGGIDIMAKLEIPPFSDIKIITLTIPCQCKGYSEENKVGINEIRNFMGALIHAKSHYGFFFTSSYYTNDAQIYVNDLKRLGYFIELFDKDRIWSIWSSLNNKSEKDKWS